jgi:outer membrane protein assembly factor BamA
LVLGQHSGLILRLKVHNLLVIGGFGLLFGCVTSRQLDKKLLTKDQYLLAHQSITGNKIHETDKLRSYYKQKVNNKIIEGITPYLYYYYIGSLFYKKESVQMELDSAKAKLARYELKSKQKPGKLKRLKERVKRKEVKIDQGNWMMRVMGEPPVVADSGLIYATGSQLVDYYHSKGFFDATSEIKIDTLGKKIRVKYIINEGTPTVIKSFKFTAADTVVQRLLDQNKAASFIKVNSNYDESLLNSERDRIERLMKNNGFYDFNKLAVLVIADTTVKKNEVFLELLINNPTGRDHHTRYIIKDIRVAIDVNIANAMKVGTTIYKNVVFTYQKDKFAKGVLYRKLRLNIGDYYSYDKSQLTQRQFSSLDNFRYVNINYQKDTSRYSPGLIMEVTLNANKKHQLSDEWGLKVSQGFPGPFGNIIFTSRNTFRGCENIDFGIRAGIEGIASVLNVNKVYTSTEYGANLGLTFPELVAPDYFRRKLNNFFPKTRLTTGYTNTIRPEYLRQSIKVNFGYSFQTKPHNRFTFNLWDFSVVNSRILSPLFTAYLDTLYAHGNPLRTSFNNSIISNISFSYTYSNNNISQNKRSRYLNILVESGGTSANLFQSFVEKISKEIGISYFQYLKINLDYRYYVPVTKKSHLATRVDFGYAQPYGMSNTLPYEKFFFSGGSNSVRAWRPRRLGPGSFDPGTLSNGAINDQNEQPGEILIEGNIEYRFPIYKFIEGAYFIDAGNVWKNPFSQDTRSGVKFSGDFYNQIAVGTGIGLRLNFSFLIFRLDIASKVWDPAQSLGQRFVLNKLNRPDQTLINIGIGYPF